jgi:DNA-binding XRE family transcriptional regulator
VRKIPITRRGIADWSAGILAVAVLVLGSLVVAKPAIDNWDALYRGDPFGLAITTKTFKQRGDRVTGTKTTKLRASAAERVFGRSGLLLVRLSLVALTAFLLAAVLQRAILADYRLAIRRGAPRRAPASEKEPDRAPDRSRTEPISLPEVPTASEAGPASLALPIAKLIASRREELGLSQRELAKRAGISHTVVSRIEQGEHTPSRKTLDRLADAL